MKTLVFALFGTLLFCTGCAVTRDRPVKTIPAALKSPVPTAITAPATAPSVVSGSKLLAFEGIVLSSNFIGKALVTYQESLAPWRAAKKNLEGEMLLHAPTKKSLLDFMAAETDRKIKFLLFTKTIDALAGVLSLYDMDIPPDESKKIQEIFSLAVVVDVGAYATCNEADSLIRQAWKEVFGEEFHKEQLPPKRFPRGISGAFFYRPN